MYRGQWFDFYSKEWSFQNGSHKPDPNRTRILVLGDSFSADNKSWVNLWKQDGAQQVFNGAVPGIGPETFRLIFPRRLEQSKPTVVIVQLYEGNDLIDIKKPVNWKAYSCWRNLYWSAGNTFRSLNFMNYRLGQSAGDVNSNVDPKTVDNFSPERYSRRTQLYISGNRNYPLAHIRLHGEQLTVFEKMCEMLAEMRKNVGNQTRFIVLTVPHCTQVAEVYRARYEKMGAKIPRIVLFGHPWADELQKAGFEVWDPLPTLRAAEKQGNSLYYVNDPHLNELGQRVLLDFVKKHWENHAP